jgi:hypothetical protein
MSLDVIFVSCAAAAAATRDNQEESESERIEVWFGVLSNFAFTSSTLSATGLAGFGAYNSISSSASYGYGKSNRCFFCWTDPQHQDTKLATSYFLPHCQLCRSPAYQNSTERWSGPSHAPPLPVFSKTSFTSRAPVCCCFVTDRLLPGAPGKYHTPFIRFAKTGVRLGSGSGRGPGRVLKSFIPFSACTNAPPSEPPEGARLPSLPFMDWT